MTDGQHHRGGLFIGILITAIGVVFLLDQMEIVHASYIFEVFWPVILIALGMSMVLRTSDFRGSTMPNPTQVPEDLSQARRTTISFWGPVLILIGGLWLLSNMTHFDAGRLWPLWLIAVGVWLLINKDRARDYSRMRRRDRQRYGPPYGWPPGSAPGAGSGSGSATGTVPGPRPPNPTSAGFGCQEYWANDRGEWGVKPPPPPENPPAAPGTPGASGNVPPNATAAPAGASASSSASIDDVFEHSIAFMAFKRRITSQHFRYAKLSAVFGGFHLDFTMADIEGPQAVIQIEAVFGGGEIRIPPSWRVSIDAHAFGGAFMDETYARPDVTAPAKTLIVRGSTVFGGVVIKN